MSVRGVGGIVWDFFHKEEQRALACFFPNLEHDAKVSDQDAANFLARAGWLPLLTELVKQQRELDHSELLVRAASGGELATMKWIMAAAKSKEKLYFDEALK